eukprot:c21573_g2_i1 orf=401-1135(+)
MVRRKIKIKKIENVASRQVTFSKRRGGLLKKAHDLSVLCDAEVAVIIFSSRGKVHQFANPSMPSVLERYMKCRDDLGDFESNESSYEGDRLTTYSKILETLQRNAIGDDLKRLSLQDLIKLEEQVHESLVEIRSRKDELLIELLEDVKGKVADASKNTDANPSDLGKLVSRPSDAMGLHYSSNNIDSTMENIIETNQMDVLQNEGLTRRLGTGHDLLRLPETQSHCLWSCSYASTAQLKREEQW